MEQLPPSDSLSGAVPGAPGQVLLGRYRIERLLGHGGMGQVLLAHDQLLNRRVALKRLSAEGADRTVLRNAILREARRASQINDRRIAAIYDVIDLGDEVLLVMEYVDGATLRERMREPVPLAEFWRLATQCVEATAAAHDHGVIHRDLKPENLMLTRDGQIKILDFGIAKRSEAAIGATTTLSDSNSKVVVGTPQYMAPEAHLGAPVDTRSDLFSLGVVFYELLTRRQPFDGATYAAVLDQVLNVDPPPVVDVNPSAGMALSNVVGRLMAKNPDDRFATTRELLTELVQAQEGGPAIAPAVRGRARPAPIPFRLAAETTRALDRGRFGSLSQRRVWVPVLALVVAALVAVGWTRWRTNAAAVLPKERNLAVLAPLTPNASEDFANFALGFGELLSDRLRRHSDTPGFQTASFTDGYDENVRNAADSRKVLGANLALLPTLEQRPDAFQARLDLFDTATNRVLASRTIVSPLSEPFTFLDRTYKDAAAMTGLVARKNDARTEYGIRGAGTLRFYLQGLAGIRMAKTEADARKAVEDLELACRSGPDAAVTRAALASAQLKAHVLGGDPQWLARAETSARDAIRRDSTGSEGHRILGVVLGREKKPEEALSETSRAAALDPTNDDVQSSLGRSYARLGRTEEEKAVYLGAIRQRPHCWQPYWWLATWHFRQGNLAESAAAYEEMIRRSPLLSKGYSSLGGVLVLRGEYPRAIDTLKRSVGLRPTKIAFDNLGTAYFNSGRLGDAIDAYNQAFQFGFANYESWLNLGEAYYWLRGRKDEAAEAYGQAIRLGHEETAARAQAGRTPDPTIPANLATVFPKLGQPDSARTYLAQAVRADSSNFQVEYCAALTHWQLNEKDRALSWLERAVHGGYPVVWLRDSPVFREWHGNAKFRELVEGTSLPSADDRKGSFPSPPSASSTPELPQAASRSGGSK